jgi:glycosyltransferase involved in cell wall biosynthesis
MRILHVLGKLDRGGVETWLLQVLRHIDRQKYQMDFLVHTTAKGAYDDEVRALGAQIIPCLRPSHPALYAKNFFRIIREYGPYDVVHSHVHHYSGYVLTLAALCGVPVRIAHSHSDTRSVNASAGLRRRMYLATMKALMRTAGTCGLAVSTEAGKELFGTGGPEFAWKIQALGIDLCPFETEVDKKQTRAALGIPLNALVIGHVGRFSQPKNHAFLVEIAREVISQREEAVFLLVGEGELRSAIEDKVRRYSLENNFIFAGARSDVPVLMKGAMDVLLFPSLHEGLPMALLEAQSAGLKCLISDTISKEADLVPSLVRRASLQQRPSDWAVQLLDVRAAEIRLCTEAIRQALIAHTIPESTRNLTAVYAQLCPA